MEVEADVVGRTMHRALKASLSYENCLAYVRGWINEKSMQKRKDWASDMLTKYPNPEDWNRVRFSDEVHFGYGPEGQLRII